MPAAAAVVGVDREVDTGAVANRETRIARDAAHAVIAGGDPVLRARADISAGAAIVGVGEDAGAVFARQETRIARDAAHTDTAGGDPVLRRGRADIIAGAAMVGVSLEVDTGVAAIRESRIIARGGAHASIAAGGPV
jgi:hypothetical protein